MEKVLADVLAAGDLLITQGAGDIGGLAIELAEKELGLNNE